MSSFTKNVVLIAGLLFALTAILFLLKFFRPQAPVKEGFTPPSIPVEAVLIQKGSYQVHLPSQGLVKARTQSRLAAQISGNVVATSAAFEVGGSFSEGDILVTVDDADYQAAFKLAKASVNQAKVALKEERARGEQALRDWQRLNSDSEPNDLVLRKPQLEAALAQLESAQAQLEKAGLDLSRTRIAAPYDGRVISADIDTGNFVNKGQALGVIVEAAQLQVELPLSAQWRHLLDWSGHSNQVQISLPDAPVPVQWTATINKTSADISPSSRQFKLLADIDIDSATRPAIALFIGDYVDASVAGVTLNDVSVLPREAVYDDEYAWAVIDEKLVKRVLSIAWADNDVAVVKSGLNDGDLVVTTPLGGVISGTRVRLIDTGENTSEVFSLETATPANQPERG